MSDSEDDVVTVRGRKAPPPAQPGKTEHLPSTAVLTAALSTLSLTEEDEDDVVDLSRLVKPSAPQVPLTTTAPAPVEGQGALPSLEQPVPSSPTATADYEKWSIGDKYAKLAGGFKIPRTLYDTLYTYQREGVAWMWSLHSECPAKAGTLGRRTERLGSGGGAPYPYHPQPGVAEALDGEAASKISGGILADDMGLGKTLQVISFISGTLHGGVASCALVILPVSLLVTWRDEFKRFAPKVIVHTLHEQCGVKARATLVAKVQEEGGVLLTTYGMMSSAPYLFGVEVEEGLVFEGEGEEEEEEGGGGGAGLRGGGKPKNPRGGGKAKASPVAIAAEILGSAVEEVCWDLLVMDEGHRIKNPATLAAKAAKAIPSRYRLLLTGTPIQNNLDELWALFDFTACGKLLDTRPNFNRLLGGRIVAARDKRATEFLKAEGVLALNELMGIVNPYLLRREKEKLLAMLGEGEGEGGVEGEGERGSVIAGTIGEEKEGRALTTGTGAAPPAPPPPPTMPSALLSLAPSSKPPTGHRTGTAMGAMGAKKEVVLWTPMAPAQLALYQGYLGAMSAMLPKEDEAEEVGGGGGGGGRGGGRRGGKVKPISNFVLATIGVLRSLSTHPALLPRSKMALAIAAAPAAGALAQGVTEAKALRAACEAMVAAGSEHPHAAKLVSTASLLIPPPPPPPPVSEMDTPQEWVPGEGRNKGEEGGAMDNNNSTGGLEGEQEEQEDEPWNPRALPSPEVLLSSSGKLRALLLLLRTSYNDGAKMLVFSQFKRTLDIIAAVIESMWALDGGACGCPEEGEEEEKGEGDFARDWAAATAAAAVAGGAVAGSSSSSPPTALAPLRTRSATARGEYLAGEGPPGPRYARIDGSFKPGERAAAVSAFNKDTQFSIPFMLLTTGVGAHGITLTAATRVAIFDPSWNPAVDAQAVDRVYRVGQSKDVCTYRLITCGGVEEKMYRLQVFKGGLTSSVMGGWGGGGGQQQHPQQQQQQVEEEDKVESQGGASSSSSSSSSSHPLPPTPSAFAALQQWDSARSAGARSSARFLTAEDMKQLLVLGDTTRSETAALLIEGGISAPPPINSAELTRHLAALATPPLSTTTVGLSHHDHLFSLSLEERAMVGDTRKERKKASAAAEAVAAGVAGGLGAAPPSARKAPRLPATPTPAPTPTPAAMNPPTLIATGGGNRVARRMVIVEEDEDEEEVGEVPLDREGGGVEEGEVVDVDSEGGGEREVDKEDEVPDVVFLSPQKFLGKPRPSTGGGRKSFGIIVDTSSSSSSLDLPIDVDASYDEELREFQLQQALFLAMSPRSQQAALAGLNDGEGL